MSDLFSKYRPLDVHLTAGAADGAVVHINGTQLILEQNEHIPVLVSIYVEDEPEPIGSINIAKNCTVALGGVDEDLTGEVRRQREALEEVVEEATTSLAELEHRLNPEGGTKPEENPGDALD